MADDKVIERKLFAGARIKRLRRELGLTQTAMADSLSISTSYLNLIEHDQRPISAQLIVQLIDVFDLDPRDLGGGEEARAYQQLLEVFADPLLRDVGLTARELKELANTSPQAAEAMGRLYRAYKESHTEQAALSERLAGVTQTGQGDAYLAMEDVRDFIAQQHNYFPALDEAGSMIYQDIMGDGQDDPYLALRQRLQDLHHVHTRIMPQEVMGENTRYYDRHRQTIFLSEMLDQPERSFQLAYQLAYLEQHASIGDIIDKAGFALEDANIIARVSLANYCAAAILMPYQDFLARAVQTQYDIKLLGRRFGTSFEQVCHRLTTLQNPAARGIPFFLIRVDSAGNISKRFSAGGFHFARLGGTCPRWHVYDAFRVAGSVNTQIIQMEDGTRYFSIARTVSRDNSGFGVPGNQFALALGCEISHAGQMIYSKGLDLERPEADTPIGINCRLCSRDNCSQRAMPSLTRTLELDEHRRDSASFGV